MFTLKAGEKITSASYTVCYDDIIMDEQSKNKLKHYKEFTLKRSLGHKILFIFDKLAI